MEQGRGACPTGRGPPEKRLAATTGAVGQPLGRVACERGGGGTIAWVGPRTTLGRGPTRQRKGRELRLAGEGRQWRLQHGEGWQLEVRRCEGGDDRGCTGGREGEGRRPPATAGVMTGCLVGGGRYPEQGRAFSSVTRPDPAVSAHLTERGKEERRRSWPEEGPPRGVEEGPPTTTGVGR